VRICSPPVHLLHAGREVADEDDVSPRSRDPAPQDEALFSLKLQVRPLQSRPFLRPQLQHDADFVPRPGGDWLGEIWLQPGHPLVSHPVGLTAPMPSMISTVYSLILDLQPTSHQQVHRLLPRLYSHAAQRVGLEAQQEVVRGYLNDGRWKLVAEFIEVESGKRKDRPTLAEALAACRLHGVKLVIAEL
jgi:hypothetical protein